MEIGFLIMMVVAGWALYYFAKVVFGLPWILNFPGAVLFSGLVFALTAWASNEVRAGRVMGPRLEFPGEAVAAYFVMTVLFYACAFGIRHVFRKLKEQGNASQAETE